MQECTDDKNLSSSARKQLQVKNAAGHSHKVNLKFDMKKKDRKKQSYAFTTHLCRLYHILNFVRKMAYIEKNLLFN